MLAEANVWASTHLEVEVHHVKKTSELGEDGAVGRR
jgi:hypothetical protein